MSDYEFDLICVTQKVRLGLGKPFYAWFHHSDRELQKEFAFWGAGDIRGGELLRFAIELFIIDYREEGVQSIFALDWIDIYGDDADNWRWAHEQPDFMRRLLLRRRAANDLTESR